DHNADGIGDVCDPHPGVKGDCFVLLETFADPATVTNHWKTIGTGTATWVNGKVQLMPAGAGGVALVALDDNGQPLAGTFDVQVDALASIKTDQSHIAAVSNLVDLT